MTDPIRLYAAPLSGNSYKVRLFLALLGLEFVETKVDWTLGENRTDEFLALNPRGQVPVLQQGELTLWDSHAILAYLARRYGPQWFPLDPVTHAQVVQWLAVSLKEISDGLMLLRGAKVYGFSIDTDEVTQWSNLALRLVEEQLQTQRWLVGRTPTIADIACFPYVALSWQGDIDLSCYPNINWWIDQLKALPGFITMPSLEPERIS